MSALDEMLAELEPWAGFDLGVDLAEFGAEGPTGATATATYAVAAMREAWLSLPADLRDVAIEQLEGLASSIAQLLVENVAQTVSEAVAEGISEGLESTPIIGAIVKTIVAIVGVGATMSDFNKEKSSQNRALARRYTLRAPELIGRTRHVQGFASYRGAGSPRWRWAACLPPDRGGARFFFGLAIPAATGKWREANGVGLNCDVHRCDALASWGGCDVIGEADDEFTGELYVNALSFPYWSPSYPSRPMPAYAIGEHTVCIAEDSDETAIDPNRALVLAQLLALVDAHANFMVPQATIISRTQALRARWESELEGGALLGNIADPFDAKRAEGFAWKLTPDLERDSGHTPTAGARRFYFDDEGLIRIYPGFEGEQLDLAAVGMNPEPDDAGEVGYACSCADYNAVVASTRAVLTARVAFLHDARKCAALVADGRVSDGDYGPDLAAAVRESAAMFAGESPPRAGSGRGPRKPGEAAQRDPGEPPLIGGGEADGGGGGALVAVALGLGAFLLVKSRR